MKRFIRNIALAILASVAFIIFSIDLSCALFPTTITEGTYDCGIILGAAVTSNQPSPVFQARLDHGIDLYQKGVVKILIFTGGVGKGDHMAESEVGATYAQDKGVPASDTLMEKTSKTTVQNLLEAKRLMEGEGMKTALIISDPLHLRRSVIIAKWLEMEVDASGTPFSRYKS